eukprot:4868970-Amphidinium_carterae.1
MSGSINSSHRTDCIKKKKTKPRPFKKTVLFKFGWGRGGGSGGRHLPCTRGGRDRGVPRPGRGSLTGKGAPFTLSGVDQLPFHCYHYLLPSIAASKPKFGEDEVC